MALSAVRASRIAHSSLGEVGNCTRECSVAKSQSVVALTPNAVLQRTCKLHVVPLQALSDCKRAKLGSRFCPQRDQRAIPANYKRNLPVCLRGTSAGDSAPTSAASKGKLPLDADLPLNLTNSEGVTEALQSTDTTDNWPWDWTQGSSSQIAFAVMVASIPLVPILPRFQWSASLYFLALALWAAYVGSHRSLQTKQAQRISLKQSFAVPILCSCSLFGLYCLLRFFPTLDLRTFFAIYLNFVGALAVGSNLSEPLRKAMPQVNDRWQVQIDLPEELATAEGQPVHVTITPSDILAVAVGLLAAVGSQQSGAPFTLGNFVAVCIVSELLQLMSLGSFATAAVMLSGLLVYDVFWVFGSSSVFGDNVMVTVATSQALNGPMKLVFPNWNPSAPSPSILGLGDLAVPGLLMALMLKFDRYRWRQIEASSTEGAANAAVTSGELPAADKSYFVAAVISYVLGLAVTVGFNAFTGAAQPALLYLVPSLLGGILLVATTRSELSLLWNYRDEPLLSDAEVARVTDSQDNVKS